MTVKTSPGARYASPGSTGGAPVHDPAEVVQVATTSLANIAKLEDPRARAEQAAALVKTYKPAVKELRGQRDAYIYMMLHQCGQPSGTGERVVEALGCHRNLWNQIRLRRGPVLEGRMTRTESVPGRISTANPRERTRVVTLPVVPNLGDDPQPYLDAAAKAHRESMKLQDKINEALDVRDSAVDELLDDPTVLGEHIAKLIGVTAQRISLIKKERDERLAEEGIKTG
jgi:hypothetical protein